jgi:hypothetical protein
LGCKFALSEIYFAGTDLADSLLPIRRQEGFECTLDCKSEASV